MRGRVAAWSVSLPIALVGIEAAHAAANRLFGSPEGPGELFATSSSGAGLLPIVAAFGAGMLLLGLGSRVFAARGRGRERMALPFAYLPPVVFVALELAEGLLHGGRVPLGTLHEPTFVVGLLLQLPFAAAGYACARALNRLSDGVRGLIERRRRRPPLPTPVTRVTRPAEDRPRPLRLPRAHSGRAPPAAQTASA
jgi:hypothetical protein